MTKSEAEIILSKINSSSLIQLSKNLINSAIRYSRIRADYYLLSIEEKAELEDERTIAHNAFISSCDILSRNMAKQGEDNSWRAMIGNNRKEIGDFACWMHLVIGLKAR
jgi:hypothetical protein